MGVLQDLQTIYGGNKSLPEILDHMVGSAPTFAAGLDAVRTLLKHPEINAGLVNNDPVMTAAFHVITQYEKAAEGLKNEDDFAAAVKQWNEVELPKLESELAITNARRAAENKPALPSYYERFEDRQNRIESETRAKVQSELDAHNARMTSYTKEEQAKIDKANEARAAAGKPLLERMPDYVDKTMDDFDRNVAELAASEPAPIGEG